MVQILELEDRHIHEIDRRCIALEPGTGYAAGIILFGNAGFRIKFCPANPVQFPAVHPGLPNISCTAIHNITIDKFPVAISPGVGGKIPGHFNSAFRLGKRIPGHIPVPCQHFFFIQLAFRGILFRSLNNTF